MSGHEEPGHGHGHHYYWPSNKPFTLRGYRDFLLGLPIKQKLLVGFVTTVFIVMVIGIGLFIGNHTHEHELPQTISVMATNPIDYYLTGTRYRSVELKVGLPVIGSTIIRTMTTTLQTKNLATGKVTQVGDPWILSFNRIEVKWAKHNFPGPATYDMTTDTLLLHVTTSFNKTVTGSTEIDGVQDAADLPVTIYFHPLQLGAAAESAVFIAFIILVMVYGVIVFELLHRTTIAMIGSFLTIGVISSIRERPALEEIISWIDFETLSLLFGMMVLVGIFAETGFFEWAAVKAYKLAKGDRWRLIVILCGFTGIASSVLDNVTTVLLLTPVTVELCKVIHVDAKPILIAEAIFSNIGGTSTGVGDPPNVMIVNDTAVKAAGVSFGSFTAAMFPGSVLVAAAVFLYMYIMDKKRAQAAAAWARVAGFLHLEDVRKQWRTGADSVMRRVNSMRRSRSHPDHLSTLERGDESDTGSVPLSRMAAPEPESDPVRGAGVAAAAPVPVVAPAPASAPVPSVSAPVTPAVARVTATVPEVSPPTPTPDESAFVAAPQRTLGVATLPVPDIANPVIAFHGRELSEADLAKYKIRDWPLFIKCASVITVVVLMFFLQSALKIDLLLSWIAIFGAMAILIISGDTDMEKLLHKVEWTTLLFFASLFILMEGLNELGLMNYIGQVTAGIISKVGTGSRLAVAIMMILWVSAYASAFIDNIPYTAAMIPIVIQLAEDPSVMLPVRPLLWSLAFGTCLGGVGTLIGSSANVVTAGLAEQRGIKITFMDFFKIGFPSMNIAVFVAMLYLLLIHVAFGIQATVEYTTSTSV